MLLKPKRQIASFPKKIQIRLKREKKENQVALNNYVILYIILIIEIFSVFVVILHTPNI